MKAVRNPLVVVTAVFVPVAACGGRIAADEPENDQSHHAAAEASSANDTADAGPSPTARPAYPCSSNTTAYYSDAGPPPATGGCRDLYSPTERHPKGCTMTIVAPAGAGTCIAAECVCSSTGSWVATGSTPAHSCP